MSSSTFRCQRCGACCRWPGAVKLTDPEVDAIADFIGLGVAEFLADYTCLTPDRQHLSLIEKTDGSCIFLEDGPIAGCRIDPVKPAQCRNFPDKWNFPGWEKECPGAKSKTH